MQPKMTGEPKVGSVTTISTDEFSGMPTIDGEWFFDGELSKAAKGLAVKPNASAEGRAMKGRLRFTFPGGGVLYSEPTAEMKIAPAEAAPVKQAAARPGKVNAARPGAKAARTWPRLYGTGSGTNELLSTYRYNGKVGGPFYPPPSYEATIGSMAGYNTASGLGPRGEGMGPAGYASFAGDTGTDDMVVAHVRAALKPGKEISAQGGYATQHDEAWLVAVYFAMNTPRLWAQFSADEKERILLIVEAAIVALAASTREAGENWKTMLGSSNSSTTVANPNIGSAARLIVVVCAAILGDAEKADAYLRSIDSEDRVRAIYDRLVAAGVKNTAASFNPDRPAGAPTYAQIAKKLGSGWTSRGFSLLECNKLVAAEIEFACSEECAAEVPSRVKKGGFAGVGRILGKVSDALKALLGKTGMYLELRGFDDADGQGIGDRSSAEYNMKAVRALTIGSIVPIVAGMVDPDDPAIKAAFAKFAIGLAHFREITRDSVGWSSFAQAGRKMSGPWGWTLMTSGQSEQWGILPWRALGDVVVAIMDGQPVVEHGASFFADAA